MNITKPEIIASLEEVVRQLAFTMEQVARKRIRPSEKVMWLADLARRFNHVQAAIRLLKE